MVRHEVDPVPPAVIALFVDDLDDLGVNLQLLTQAFVVLVCGVNPLVDVFLDHSLGEFRGHHVLDAAAGGVGVALVHTTDGVDDEVVRGDAKVSLHGCEF